MKKNTESTEILASLDFFPFFKNTIEGSEDAKSVGSGPWKFAGIASDTTEDEDGDTILHKHLDLRYANSRGFVNWDHSEASEDQIGFLTKAVLVDGSNRKQFAKQLGVEIRGTASVYVEGELYQYVENAENVANLMKSAPPGKGLGLSLQGGMARDRASNDVVKAFVRGVAITPVPAHANTLATLMKSISSANEESAMDENTPVSELVKRIGDLETLCENLRKKVDPDPVMLTQNQAIMKVLEENPHWTYQVAERAVALAFTKKD